MPNKYTKILPGNQSNQVQLKINALETGILSFISINEWNNGKIKQMMRDHFPFMQELKTPYVKLKTSYVELKTSYVELKTSYAEQLETSYVELRTSYVEQLNECHQVIYNKL